MKKFRYLLAIVIVSAVFFSSSSIFSMPPREGIDIPETLLETRIKLGVDVIVNPVRDKGMKGIYNTIGDVKLLVSGTKKFPVVLINYPDFPNQYSVSEFQQMLFGSWTSGSAKDYFHEISYNQFTLDGTVSGWYIADSNKSYYGQSNGDVRAAMLAKKAAQKADAAINFADFDNDGDGFVDCFTVIHAGYGAEETGSGSDIRSHAWSFSSAGIGAYLTNDGVTIDAYAIGPERSGNSNNGTMACIGVFVHEWGHALGLPDLYDTDGGGSGLGNWCLMAGGSWGGDGASPWKPVHMCAWAKMDLGWLNPTVVRHKDLYSIPQIETNSKAYWLISRQRTSEEYFLVENRRKTGFDTLLYESGLLIYHIDNYVIGSRRGVNQVNAGGTGWKYGVALEQADGNDDLYNNRNRGDAGDPYPGITNNTAFDSTTTPNSLTNYPLAQPLKTGCLAKTIPQSAPSVSCTLSSGISGAEVALVIDCSGSMYLSGYIEPAKTAASTFVTFMEQGDGVAVVSFDDLTYLNFPLTTITSDATKTKAKAAINSITGGGSTSIGGGMQLAQSELNRGTTQIHQAMLLLSDGYENTPPWVDDVLPGIPENTDIYTIALGPDSDQQLLNRIATTTGGQYFFAPGPLHLLAIYNLIRGKITNQQTLASFDGEIGQGQTVSHPAIVDALTTEASFLLSYGGSEVDLELVSPSGVVIDSAVADTSQDIEYIEGLGFDYYTIKSPEIGVWQLKIIGVDVPAVEPYTVAAQGVSDLTLDGFLGKEEPEIGQPIPVLAKLLEYDQPITGASIIAEIQSPSVRITSGFDRHYAKDMGLIPPILDSSGASLYGSNSGSNTFGENIFMVAVDTLVLSDDGHHGDSLPNDGIYANYYLNAFIPGSYTFTLRASGTGNQAGQFERICKFSAYIDTTSRPFAPMLSSPSNCAESLHPPVQLIWRKSGQTPTYHLQVATEQNFTIPVVDTANLVDTTFVLRELAYGATYCWRVRAERLGLVSDWSLEWWFSTVFTPETLAVSPNPFVPSRGHTVFSFFGAGVPGAEIKIYNKAGELVKTIKPEETKDKDRYDWNVKSENNKDLASGVYIYVAKEKSGTTRKGKFAIIR